MPNKSEDRGMMKWAAFHSVMSEDEVNSYINMSNPNEKPELSEDQINELEQLIIDAYYNKSVVTLTIYKKQENSIETGIITKLDGVNKLVYLDKKPIPFSDILSIKFE
ncbi:MAG: YolD-like family protein [Bacilli bacterium]|nr:YolD-like family protein [Bacilli bacterium]